METETAVGGTGDFEVFVDGTCIYSKQEKGRFPEAGEIESLIQSLGGR